LFLFYVHGVDLEFLCTGCPLVDIEVGEGLRSCWMMGVSYKRVCGLECTSMERLRLHGILLSLPPVYLHDLQSVQLFVGEMSAAVSMRILAMYVVLGEATMHFSCTYLR
jgi:hypothetical protein